MMCVMINYEKYRELHNTLDHHFEKLLIDQQISSTVLNNFRNFRRLSWALIFLVTIVTLITAGRPIISIISQYLNSGNPIIFPHFYPTLYPGFRFHFIIEFAATVPFFCVSPSMDSLFMMYIFQMSGQFREMSYRIMHIDQMGDDKIAIQQCVHQHQTMMRCRDMLQEIFGPILLWVVATNAISLCSLIFQLTQA
uniref:Olfactory receptor 65 n=1 Tax=Meteorus pulchricornis TaxID=51522 RepID=A0A1S5VFR3_9HYME|nr:olfactory receptor 65 [Meteorus pulchricornis]